MRCWQPWARRPGGIYNGYELIENKQRPGFEEQIDNEKYEVKVRDWSKAKQYGVAEMLTARNKIRRAHPAALSYHNLTGRRLRPTRIFWLSHATRRPN